MKERFQFWLISGLTLAGVIVASIFITLAFNAAFAQSRDLTGGEMLQHYQAGGISQDTVSMYVMGVVDGMGMAGAICVPQDKPKGDYVRQVVYNLGANEQLHERRFDVAVSSAAVLAYPCGEAS